MKLSITILVFIVVTCLTHKTPQPTVPDPSTPAAER